MTPRVGVLALQGDFAAHARTLAALGAPPAAVRHPAELAALAALVIPGGESTTLLNLMADEPWFEALPRFHATGGAILGTCAGAILVAREVRGWSQRSLGFVDAVVERNGFGRQVDSFEATLDVPALGGRLEALFIRAPRIRETGPDVEIVARLDGEPVMVRQGRVVALTFHPELASEATVHRWFMTRVVGGRSVPLTPEARVAAR